MSGTSQQWYMVVKYILRDFIIEQQKAQHFV